MATTKRDPIQSHGHRVSELAAALAEADAEAMTPLTRARVLLDLERIRGELAGLIDVAKTAGTQESAARKGTAP